MVEIIVEGGTTLRRAAAHDALETKKEERLAILKLRHCAAQLELKR